MLELSACPVRRGANRTAATGGSTRVWTGQTAVARGPRPLWKPRCLIPATPAPTGVHLVPTMTRPSRPLPSAGLASNLITASGATLLHSHDKGCSDNGYARSRRPGPMTRAAPQRQAWRVLPRALSVALTGPDRRRRSTFER